MAAGFVDRSTNRRRREADHCDPRRSADRATAPELRFRNRAQRLLRAAHESERTLVARVMRTITRLDLERGFSRSGSRARKISTISLKRSARAQQAPQSAPFRSAMSMLNFHIISRRKSSRARSARDSTARTGSGNFTERNPTPKSALSNARAKKARQGKPASTVGASSSARKSRISAKVSTRPLDPSRRSQAGFPRRAAPGVLRARAVAPRARVARLTGSQPSGAQTSSSDCARRRRRAIARPPRLRTSARPRGYTRRRARRGCPLSMIAP